MSTFLGVEHGTRAIRFATLDGRRLAISRAEAASLTHEQIITRMEDALDIVVDDVEMAAITYSMGDGLSRITPIERVHNRGIVSREGAGVHIGGGTRVFDAIKGSGMRAVVVCELHRGNCPDERMNVFSHGASPEKIGIAYHVYQMGYGSFVLSDVSSNTVSVGVAEGRLVGAIDACIFAPGLIHGPLDLDAIRMVDEGVMSANEAFSRGGVLKLFEGYTSLEELIERAPAAAERALDTIALLAAMEMAAGEVLVRDYTSEGVKMVLTGSIGAMDAVAHRVRHHLGKDVLAIDGWSAAVGCAQIARAVADGCEHVLGIGVESPQ